MTTPAYSTPMLSGVKPPELCCRLLSLRDRKSTRLNSSHSQISYAVFCLKKKKKNEFDDRVLGTKRTVGAGVELEHTTVGSAGVRSLVRPKELASDVESAVDDRTEVLYAR